MDSVLVTEEIADAGVDLLRDRFKVDVELGLPADELAGRIGGYDGLIVRSATRVTADLIDRAGRLRVIGRAGTGVDNVDVAAATRRGIIVANAPGSNMVAAAEHAIGCSWSPWPATSRRRTPPSSRAGGSARATPASSLPTRRSPSSASAASGSSSRPARGRSACASSSTTRSCRPSAAASSR